MRRRYRLIPNRYWYLSPAADEAIDASLSRHPRRWDPRDDSPSLATLQGEANLWGASYLRSRNKTLEDAGVSVISGYFGPSGRLCYIVTMPGEPISAAVRVERETGSGYGRMVQA